MKINVTKGANPLNLVNYLLDHKKQQHGVPPAVNTNMFGSTAEELSEEFRFSHNLNPRVKQTMAHFSMSLSPGERIDPASRHAITKRLLELTGHGDCQYVSAEHFDQVHKNDVQHWHLATSNVDLDGNHVEDDFLWSRLRIFERQLEQEFDLRPTPLIPERDRRHIPTGEFRLKERTGEVLPREKLWDKIQEHTADAPSMAILTARLKAEQVEVRFQQREGKITGLSYEFEGWACSGRKLGDAYSFPGLQKYLDVSHDLQQDQVLLQLQMMSAAQCREWLRLRREKEQGENELQILDTSDVKPQAKSEAQLPQEPDLTDGLLREQADFAARLAPLVQQIWQLQKLTNPLLQSAAFEDYSIRLSQEGNPELYRRDLLLLNHSDNHDSDSGSDRALNLSQLDGDAIHQFLALSQHQAQEHRLLIHKQQMDKQKTQKKRQKNPRSLDFER